jgi:hypothetical protein
MHGVDYKCSEQEKSAKRAWQKIEKQKLRIDGKA